MPPSIRAPLVLLIEDDSEVANLIGELLAEEGYRVESVPSGADGLRQARRLRPDVISLDLGLPGRSGFQVLDELRRHPATWDIPVLIVTAYESDVLERAPQVPLECFFSKPLELRRYLDAIAKAAGYALPLDR